MADTKQHPVAVEIEKLRTALKAPNPSIEALKAAQTRASKIVEQEAANLDRLAGLEMDLARTGSDADLDRHESEVRNAGRRRLRAAALLEDIGQALGELEAKRAEQSKREEYAAAKSALAEVGRRLQEARSAARVFRALIKSMAEAALLVDRVNARLPDGESALPQPERLRGWPLRMPLEVVEETEVILWVNGNGTPLPAEMQDKVHLTKPGIGRLPDGSEVGEGAFMKVRYRPFEPGWHPDILTTELKIPALCYGDMPAWQYDEGIAPPEYGVVLSKIAEYEEKEARPPVERRVIETLVPLETYLRRKQHGDILV